MLELLTVLVVISILAVLITGVIQGIKAKAERALCVSNLKNLYTAAAAYIQQNEVWPQVSTANVGKDGNNDYDKAWIAALGPFGLGQKNWACPTVERMLGDLQPDQVGKTRVDYFATPFDDKPFTAYRWPKQPWFAERGALHQGGNLLILTNGQVLTLREVLDQK